MSSREKQLKKSGLIQTFPKDYERLLFFYSKASNNLNQLAHSVNRSWKKDIVSERLYAKFLNELVSIRELLSSGVSNADQG